MGCYRFMVDGSQLSNPFLPPYDGRGNAVVKTEEVLADVFKTLNSTDVYAEKWVPFKKELAVMVVRSATGEFVVSSHN